MGEEKAMYVPCSENHFRERKTLTWHVSFSCKSHDSGIFHMRPNGHFHSGTVHSDLEPKPKNDYKDSLVIYVGKCASIAD